VCHPIPYSGSGALSLGIYRPHGAVAVAFVPSVDGVRQQAFTVVKVKKLLSCKCLRIRILLRKAPEREYTIGWHVSLLFMRGDTRFCPKT
jgi:hypothetical protein